MRVNVAKELERAEDRVDDALNALARLDLSASKEAVRAAEAEYAAAQAALHRFRDRWARGGRGVRGGTV